jgi:hypothetical protein
VTDPIPLEANVVREQDGVCVTLPLRREAVSVSKRVVVTERVVIRRQPASQTERAETSVKRERLRVDLHGDVDTTQPLQPLLIGRGRSALAAVPPAIPTRRSARATNDRCRVLGADP